MSVWISVFSKEKVYHENWCPYARRIRYKNRKKMSAEQAEAAGYRPCRCCHGVGGYAYLHKKELAEKREKGTLQCVCDLHSQTLYLRTDRGFWKIFEKDGRYELMHRNDFSPERKAMELRNGRFHRQWDAGTAYQPDKLVRYAEKHDEAIKVIEDDYRKLPRRTKRENGIIKMPGEGQTRCRNGGSTNCLRRSPASRRWDDKEVFKWKKASRI